MSTSDSSKKALERAIEAAGSVGNLASVLGVASSAPSMWKSRGKVPAQYCPAIERFTRLQGKPVTCEELCPTGVDWAVLREQSEPAKAA